MIAKKTNTSALRDTFSGKTVLITGGTGSFGKNFAKYVLDRFDVARLVILSRDELKQFELRKTLTDTRVRFFIGDVRDAQRLKRAFHGVDIVVHAAALKQVPALEYNPFEAVKTNVLGTQNVIEAAIDEGVKKVLLISTDKAAQPINLYGATKLCAEKLMVSGNSYSEKTSFSVVRYGNVIGSRGSIVEHLLNNRGAKTVSVTDPEMTRFWLTLEQSFELVMFALSHMVGGEIFIPKVPSMKMDDVFDVVVPKAKKEITGIRPGEKMHEVLMTEHEARRAFDLGDYFVVLPEFNFGKSYVKYDKYPGGNKVASSFCYTSDTNTEWMTKDGLRTIIESFSTI